MKNTSGDPKNPPEEEPTGGPEVAEQAVGNNSTALVLTSPENPPTVVDDQVTELQEQLAEAKDEKNELIFYVILGAVIVFDVFAFNYIGNALGILIIAIFECLLLLGAARRLGVEAPAVILASLVRAIEDRIRGGKD